MFGLVRGGKEDETRKIFWLTSSLTAPWTLFILPPPPPPTSSSLKMQPGQQQQQQQQPPLLQGPRLHFDWQPNKCFPVRTLALRNVSQGEAPPWACRLPASAHPISLHSLVRATDDARAPRGFHQAGSSPSSSPFVPAVKWWAVTQNGD